MVKQPKGTTRNVYYLKTKDRSNKDRVGVCINLISHGRVVAVVDGDVVHNVLHVRSELLDRPVLGGLAFVVHLQE